MKTLAMRVLPHCVVDLRLTILDMTHIDERAQIRALLSLAAPMTPGSARFMQFAQLIVFFSSKLCYICLLTLSHFYGII